MQLQMSHIKNPAGYFIQDVSEVYGKFNADTDIEKVKELKQTEMVFQKNG